VFCQNAPEYNTPKISSILGAGNGRVAIFLPLCRYAYFAASFITSSRE
jgi:hypothetical protein